MTGSSIGSRHTLTSWYRYVASASTCTLNHGLVGVARDVTAGINQSRFVKKSIRKECAYVDVNGILNRAGWRDPKLTLKRKVFQPSEDHQPLTGGEVKKLLEEGRKAREEMGKRLDRLSAPYDLFDNSSLIDGVGLRGAVSKQTRKALSVVKRWLILLRRHRTLACTSSLPAWVSRRPRS